MLSTRENKGLLVIIEGIEACGKSTQVSKLKEELTAAGLPVTICREPGGTNVGEAVRNIFLSEFDNLQPEVEVALLLAAKKQLQETVIKPALARGDIVICDRSDFTLRAYQCGGKNIPHELVNDLVRSMRCETRYDVVFYLHVDLVTSQGRLIARRLQGGEHNAIDAQRISFHQRVFEMFERLFGNLGGPTYVRVDGTKTEQEITNHMIQEIVSRYREKIGHGEISLRD